MEDEVSKVDAPDVVAEQKVIPGALDAFEAGGEEKVNVRIVEVFNGAPAGMAAVDVVAVLEVDVTLESEQRMLWSLLLNQR